jgi:rare lipoprotein A
LISEWMTPGVVRRCVAPALLALLALMGACTTLPAPPFPSFPPVSSPATPAFKVPFKPAVKAEQAGAPADAASLPAPVVDDKYQLTGDAARELERGQASWYGPRFHGRRTASGERHDMYALTAAHKTLPFGTLVRVRSVMTGREVDVRINDRGPFIKGRVIDVSKAAAEALGMMEQGVKDVLLLVPESTPLELAPPLSGRKSRRASRRSPSLRLH